MSEAVTVEVEGAEVCCRRPNVAEQVEHGHRVLRDGLGAANAWLTEKCAPGQAQPAFLGPLADKLLALVPPPRTRQERRAVDALFDRLLERIAPVVVALSSPERAAVKDFLLRIPAEDAAKAHSVSTGRMKEIVALIQARLNEPEEG